MTTTDFIQTMRQEIKKELLDELLIELQPLVEQKLYGNVFDFQEALKYLHVSDSTLRRMVADGEVPYFKQRGQYFFRQSSLDSAISQQELQNYQSTRRGQV